MVKVGHFEKELTVVSLWSIGFQMIGVFLIFVKVIGVVF